MFVDSLGPAKEAVNEAPLLRPAGRDPARRLHRRCDLDSAGRCLFGQQGFQPEAHRHVARLDRQVARDLLAVVGGLAHDPRDRPRGFRPYRIHPVSDSTNRKAV